MIPKKRKITRRRVLLALGAMTLGTGLYAWRVEPHWVQVVERRLDLKRLPRGLIGSRMVQLSDLHIGPQVDDDYLRNVFDRVTELQPEIVLYTGDFLNYNAEVDTHGRRMMANLPLGTQATLGILGNHDYGPGWSNTQKAARIADLAEQRGVRILRNDVAEVAGLRIAGLDDLWSGLFDLQKVVNRLEPESCSLVLAHNPDSVDQPGWDSYSGWILAGHTHGGQVKPPFLPPPVLPVRNTRYASGDVVLSGHRRLYINRGIGYHQRVRLNARPEITVFTLARTDEESTEQ